MFHILFIWIHVMIIIELDHSQDRRMMTNIS